MFGAGCYAPETTPGKHLLAHELTHVVQQRGVEALQRHATEDCDENATRQTMASQSSGAGVSGVRATRAKLQAYANLQRSAGVAPQVAAQPGVRRKAWVNDQPLSVDRQYQEIVRKAWGEKALRCLLELHTDSKDHKFANWGALIAAYEKARDAADIPSNMTPEDPCKGLPGFGQRDPSCAAASLITPILIWDNEQFSAGDPNVRLRSIVAKMNAYLQRNKAALEARFESREKGMLKRMIMVLDWIGAQAAADDFKMTSEQFKSLGLMLLLISQENIDNGLDNAETARARTTLGFPPEMTPVVTFGDFFDQKGALASMRPGQMAQLVWFVNDPSSQSMQPVDALQQEPALPTHAFTVGRLKDGTWVLNDQGYEPALCLRGSDLVSLKVAMLNAAKGGMWWGSDRRGVSQTFQRDYSRLHDPR